MSFTLEILMKRFTLFLGALALSAAALAMPGGPHRGGAHDHADGCPMHAQRGQPSGEHAAHGGKMHHRMSGHHGAMHGAKGEHRHEPSAPPTK